MKKNQKEDDGGIEKRKARLNLKSLLLFFILIFLSVSTIKYLGWSGKSASSSQHKSESDVLLQKKEWFENLANRLEKMQIEVAARRGNFLTLKEIHKDLAWEDWPGSDKAQSDFLKNRIIEIKAEYNQLAREYNSEMPKYYRLFYNSENPAPETDKSLPREFEEYPK